MPRIPYHPDVDLPGTDLIQKTRRKRGGRLLHIDRMLMHSQPLMQGWSVFLGAVRNELGLEAHYRELAICVVSARNRTEYELHHHRQPFLLAGGSEQQFEALSDLETARSDARQFDTTERSIINLAIELTDQPAATDACLQRARDELGNDQKAVELVALIGAYNMVSRVVNTLDIQVENV